MPVIIRNTKAFAEKISIFTQGDEQAFEEIGKDAARMIVQTTLAGIGEDDAPFKPYSESYQKLLDHVGGKPSGIVDLRGIFYHKGRGPKRFKDPARERKRQRRALEKGGGRRAFMQVTLGGRTFLVTTQLTRPRLGLVDPQSEMSADLISVRVTKTGFRLVYQPRRADETYMLTHQQDRPWFTVNKTAVAAVIFDGLRAYFKAKVRRWNNS
jgi:hypothetical protein